MLSFIEFSYTESATQQNLFTPHHRKYDCTIKYNDKQFTIQYQCNPKYTKPTLEEFINSILLDMFAYDDSKNVVEFASDIGYPMDSLEEYRYAKHIYNDCGKISHNIHRMFTDFEINTLIDELDKMGY